MRPSLATRGQRGDWSPTRGTRSETVGPAAATPAGVPVRRIRRTVGVTSPTETTVSTSTGRRPSEDAPVAGSGVVTSLDPRRPENGPTRPPPGEWERPGRRSWTEGATSPCVAGTLRLPATIHTTAPSTETLRDQKPVATARIGEVCARTGDRWARAAVPGPMCASRSGRAGAGTAPTATPEGRHGRRVHEGRPRPLEHPWKHRRGHGRTEDHLRHGRVRPDRPGGQGQPAVRGRVRQERPYGRAQAGCAARGLIQLLGAAHPHPR